MIVAALASTLIAASTPAAAVTLFDQQSRFAVAAGGVRFENFDRFSGINPFAAAPFDVGSFRLLSSPGASATNAVRSGGGSVVNGTTQVVGRVEDGSRSLFIELDEYSTVLAADFRGFNNPLFGQARTDLVINGQLVGVPILGGESDWEHQFGITVDTLDNPGWSLKVDLDGTTLEGLVFPPLYEGVSEAE